VVLGVVWAGLLVAGAEAGAPALAVVAIPVATVAAVSGVRAVVPRRAAVRPLVVLAAATGFILPLAGLGGPTAAVVVGAVLVAAAVTLLAVTWRGGFPLVAVLAAFAPAIAAASVVVARGQGLSESLTLIAAVCLYDMASFMTGTGPRGGIAGAIVGMVTVGVLAVFVAAVVVPPFSGRSPWILLGLVAVLAPAGVAAAGRIGPNLRLPALRRLDSLILAGPAWVIGVGLLLHR
jgi:hypothetical protein